MLHQDDSQHLQPLQQPPDDPSDQAASMSPFPRLSSPFIFSSSNPTSPSFSISDASSYGSPISCVSSYSPNSGTSFDSAYDASSVQVGPSGLVNPIAQFPSGPHSASDASNVQAAPNGLFNPSMQFVSNLDCSSDASTMHAEPIGSFSSMTQYAPSSTLDPSIMQADPHGVFTPMRQLTTPSSYSMNGGATHGFDGTYRSGATGPIQRLLQQPPSLQPWNSGVQQSQLLQSDGHSYGQHPQPHNHTKVDLWSMSSASQLSVGATSPPPDDPFNTNKQTESPKTIAELLSVVRDESVNDEGSTWITKPASARDGSDDEEDSSADCTFVAPSPYSHVAPSPWVPQNKLLLSSMDPPPPPAAPVFEVPKKPAPKPTVDTELALNSFEGEQKQIIVGLIDKIKELTDEKEKANKEKKKPVIEGNSYFDKESLARRTNPSIFQFPARIGREVQLDLCRTMVGYTEISRMSKTSITNFLKHILQKIYENPMASQRVTAACTKSTKGYRVLPQSSMRTLAKFWMAHFKHTHEHSLTRITDLITLTIKNLLDRNRSEVVVRGMQPSSSKST